MLKKFLTILASFYEFSGMMTPTTCAREVATISGDYYFEAGIVKEGKWAENPRPADLRDRTRINVDAEKKFENNLLAGVKLRFHTDTQGILFFEQSYAFIAEPNFGQLQLGTNFGVNDRQYILAPNDWGTGGADGSYSAFLLFTGGLPLLNINENITSNLPVARIQYFSPRTYGFELGAGYTPATDSSGTDINRSRRLQPFEFQQYSDMWEIGLNSKNSFYDNKIGVNSSIGYIISNSKETSNGLSVENINSFQVGLQVMVGSVIVGGGYVNAFSSGQVKSASYKENNLEWTAGAELNFSPFIFWN